MKPKKSITKIKKFLTTVTAVITLAGLIPSAFLIARAADFDGTMVISSATLSFQNIPESFSFGSITSGPAQGLFNNNNTDQAPTASSPGADLLQVLDDRNAGGFTVTVDAAGTFTDGTDTIPANNLYVVTSLDESNVENGDPANQLSCTPNAPAISGTPTGIFVKPDGLRFFFLGSHVNEYDISTAWNIDNCENSYTDRNSVTVQDSTPQGIFFKPDGSKMYMAGSQNSTVYEYTYLNAWRTDPTPQALSTFDVSTEETTPTGIFFKSDGTKMYVVGSNSDNVNEYALSSAWDVTTASITSTFDVSSQDGTPQGLFFKSDGTKMYVVGDTNDSVYEYDLGTAWDVTSASYSQALDVSGQDATPTDLFIKSDGTKMYIMGDTNDTVYQYLLSTAWDISTATFQTEKAGVSYNNTVPSDDRNITAPVYVDVDSLDLDTAATFTDLSPDSRFGSGPVVLMNGSLPLTEGRDGTFSQFVSFYLLIPALQEEGKYDLILTYTLTDSTT